MSAYLTIYSKPQNFKRIFPNLGTVEIETNVLSISAMLEVIWNATVEFPEDFLSKTDLLYVIINI